MLKLTRKTVMAHKRRLIGTGLSVIIGIAFLAGTFVFTDTIKRTFDNLFADVYTNTDVYVRSNQSIEGDFGQTQRPPHPRHPSSRTVRRRPAWPRPRATCRASPAIIGKDGKPIGRTRAVRPPSAANVSRPATCRRGRWPTAGPRAAPTRSCSTRPASRTGKFTLGDPVTDRQPGRQPAVHHGRRCPVRRHRLRRRRHLRAVRPADGAGLHRPARHGRRRARQGRRLGQPDRAGPARPDRRSPARPRGADGQGDHEGEPVRHRASALSFFNILLLVFAGIALFVSIFIIYNTFSIIVAQRQREHGAAAGRRRQPAPGARQHARRGHRDRHRGLARRLRRRHRRVGGAEERVLSALGIDIPAGRRRGAAPHAHRVAHRRRRDHGASRPSCRRCGPRRTPPMAAMRDVALDTSGTLAGPG